MVTADRDLIHRGADRLILELYVVVFLRTFHPVFSSPGQPVIRCFVLLVVCERLTE